MFCTGLGQGVVENDPPNRPRFRRGDRGSAGTESGNIEASNSPSPPPAPGSPPQATPPSHARSASNLSTPGHARSASNLSAPESTSSSRGTSPTTSANGDPQRGGFLGFLSNLGGRNNRYNSPDPAAEASGQHGPLRGRRSHSPPRPPHPQEGSFPFDEPVYTKFGLIKKVRHIRFHKQYLGIRSHFVAQFDVDTHELQQVFDLEGAQVSGQEGREFVVTGPHLGTPWLLRAGSRDDALAWCQAFAYASRFGRAMRAHRERPPPPPPDAEVEAKRVEEYRALIDGIVADAPVSPMTDERAGKALKMEHGQWDPACPRCKDKYDDGARTPLLLDCKHSACQACCIEMEQKGELICPQCDEPTKVPEGGARALPKNYALLDLKVHHNSKHDLRRLDTVQVIDDAGGTCPVCLDVFTEKAPLVFACGHTVCAECVFGIALRCKDGTAICPECRVPTRLDGALRVNVALQETLGDIVAVKQVRLTALRHWALLRNMVFAVYAFNNAIGKKLKSKAPKQGPKIATGKGTVKGTLKSPSAKKSTTRLGTNRHSSGYSASSPKPEAKTGTRRAPPPKPAAAATHKTPTKTAKP